jgi:hypothetical protein
LTRDDRRSGPRAYLEGYWEVALAAFADAAVEAAEEEGSPP